MKDAIMRAPRPPQALTRLQIVEELVRRDLWETVEAAIDADPVTRRKWAFANEVRIDDALFLSVAAFLGMDANEVNDFARQAAWRTDA